MKAAHCQRSGAPFYRKLPVATQAERGIFMLVSPSILAADFSRLAEEVQRVSTADLLHVDVMDGHFVPNISIGAAVAKAIRPHSKLPFDVHLMLSHPLEYLESFANAGADILSGHIEAEDDPAEVIARTVSLGKKAGIAINPHTDPALMRKVAEQGDYIYSITVMTVQPGFGGQSFMPEALEKIPELRKMFPKALIELDGGVNMTTLPQCTCADILVAGTAVFGAEDPAAAIAQLQACTMQ